MTCAVLSLHPSFTFLLYLPSPNSLTVPFSTIHTGKMARSALLIGNITHARKEWEELSSLLELKVGKHCVTGCQRPKR